MLQGSPSDCSRSSSARVCDVLEQEEEERFERTLHVVMKGITVQSKKLFVCFPTSKVQGLMRAVKRFCLCCGF